MTTCTISEALQTLKAANATEVQDEIDILAEEIAELRTQIKARQRTIASIRRFAGLKAAKKTDAAAGETPPPKAPGRMEQIRELLRHAGPMRNRDIARQLGMMEQSSAPILKKWEGREFERIEDGRWRIKAG